MEPQNGTKIIIEAMQDLSARLVKANERIDCLEQCINRQNSINISTRKCIEGLDAKAGLLFRCTEIMSKAVLASDEPELTETARREIAELRRMFEGGDGKNIEP